MWPKGFAHEMLTGTIHHTVNPILHFKSNCQAILLRKNCYEQCSCSAWQVNRVFGVGWGARIFCYYSNRRVSKRCACCHPSIYVNQIGKSDNSSSSFPHMVCNRYLIYTRIINLFGLVPSQFRKWINLRTLRCRILLKVSISALVAILA